MSTSWDDPSNSARFGREFAAFIHAFGLLRSDTTPCGQPMSVSTAHALCELRTGPALNQRDLAARLGLTTSAVSRLVDQLEGRAWARRAEDPDSTDGRVRLVLLTDQGRAMADRVLDARVARFGRLLDAVPDGRQQDVLDSLELLKEAARATN